MKELNRICGLWGLSSVVVFVTSLLVFSSLNSDFDIINDYVSKLGAKGEPHALEWNVTGFFLVGCLYVCFGFAYGKVLNDRMIGWLLSMFGLGYAFTAIPFDLNDSESPVSKAHTVAICLALASWLFGLAKISSIKTINKRILLRANVASLLLVISIIGAAVGILSMPVTHRLVFIVVFGWTIVTSFDLIMNMKKQ